MAVKPILFSTEMVRALLAGRKTVTRRVMKPQPLFYTGRRYVFADDVCPKKWEDCDDIISTYQYQPGDILYVRETRQFVPCTDCHADAACAEHPQTYETQACVYDGCYLYLADYPQVDAKKVHWHPSIHMPREAARIFLQVTNVRVELLQDMRLKDFIEEGVMLASSEIDDCIKAPIRARERYSAVWDSTIKPKDRSRYGWAANPWVWVIKFERISKEEADIWKE